MSLQKQLYIAIFRLCVHVCPSSLLKSSHSSGISNSLSLACIRHTPLRFWSPPISHFEVGPRMLCSAVFDLFLLLWKQVSDTCIFQVQNLPWKYHENIMKGFIFLKMELTREGKQEIFKFCDVNYLKNRLSYFKTKIINFPYVTSLIICVYH